MVGSVLGGETGVFDIGLWLGIVHACGVSIDGLMRACRVYRNRGWLEQQAAEYMRRPVLGSGNG